MLQYTWDVPDRTGTANLVHVVLERPDRLKLPASVGNLARRRSTVVLTSHLAAAAALVAGSRSARRPHKPSVFDPHGRETEPRAAACPGLGPAPGVHVAHAQPLLGGRAPRATRPACLARPLGGK